jgi:hypothetical protein
MIDARHDEIPSEMRRLLAIRRHGEWPRRKPVAPGVKALDSISVPQVQGAAARCRPEKLLCGA